LVVLTLGYQTILESVCGFAKTKRWWIISMQLLIGGGLAGVAFFIPMSFFFQATLAVFWLLAFSSATHDIAADGFYMLALDDEKTIFFYRHTQYLLSFSND
jgi:hypothetical protein